MTDAPTGPDPETPDAPPSWGTPATTRRTPSAGTVSALCLTGGTWLIGALFLQFGLVNLSFGGPAPAPTSGESIRYVVTAIACLALLAVGTAVAYLDDRLGRVLLALPLLALGVATVFLLPVPSDRWEREAPVTERATQGPVCRSGGDSDDCPGG